MRQLWAHRGVYTLLTTLPHLRAQLLSVRQPPSSAARSQQPLPTALPMLVLPLMLLLR